MLGCTKKEVKKFIDAKIDQYGELRESSEEQLWTLYKDAKSKIEEAKQNNDFENIIKNLKVTAEASHFLNRPDIESWQLNNIGHYSIEKFKKENEINKLIGNYYKTGNQEKEIEKQKLKDALDANEKLLKTAKKYLEKAKEVDLLNPDENRQRMINNNLKYIEEIEEIHVNLF